MLTRVDENFEARLRQVIPEDVIRHADARYLEEPRGRWAGQAGLVLAPTQTEQVAEIIRACAAEDVPVIPYGGGTGLVGGQVAEGEMAPVILSLERMTRIREVHPEENVLVAEAGVILADVQAAAAEVDRLFPLSLAAEGSARIGGNLATNAGGVNVLRYGNARDLCLGLEAVLPDGQIWHGLSRLRKDNAGYDLRNLLIGSEGTLGVITAASLKLAPVPAVKGTAMFVVPTPEAALRLLTLARAQMGEGISAFELMHRQGFDFLAEVLPDVRRPFDTSPDWCVLIELGLARGLNAEAALAELFEHGHGEGITSDAVIAQSQAQRDQFWAVREQMPEANRRIGSVSSHDISVPIGAIPDFIAQGEQVIAALGPFRINCFGHVGDGNLHYNVFPMPGKTRADHMEERDKIKRAVHDLVHRLEGSVSAEHGVGRLKVGDLERYGDPAKLAAMRAIKAALDPKGIMNPGAVLRA
ncbi:FAD-binding oxidoreductase [Thalassococcus sp. S3]|uniref:FAD-binding oxidoreductase n=1 Tax=Thalassococcus sp. S3 TaxID=2017482 RepID=UPI001024625A|nr:FAD-binding oxidoreductase [Thalassococcus sp. S3]QBF32931.1 hydroxyacid dehydrogenase [Thalassococcus sp. S3]